MREVMGAAAEPGFAFRRLQAVPPRIGRAPPGLCAVRLHLELACKSCIIQHDAYGAIDLGTNILSMGSASEMFALSILLRFSILSMTDLPPYLTQALA